MPVAICGVSIAVPLSMHAECQIDIHFDFRSDTPPGKDPDACSPTLRRYHRQLWSKPLPSGARFDLVATRPRAYLYHASELGEYVLTSDSVIPTFTRSARIAHLISQVPLEERERFVRLSYTMGGMMLFPGNKIAGGMTINGARGCHHRIKDRFDLTVECIRRHYRHERSPLRDTLSRYAGFFQLFGSFEGFVEFFLLQDLVTDDCTAVRFFTPFDDFQPWPLPRTTTEYGDYLQRATKFLVERNERILGDARSWIRKPHDDTI